MFSEKVCRLWDNDEEYAGVGEATDDVKRMHFARCVI
jgi:hypothetical protein